MPLFVGPEERGSNKARAAKESFLQLAEKERNIIKAYNLIYFLLSSLQLPFSNTDQVAGGGQWPLIFYFGLETSFFFYVDDHTVTQLPCLSVPTGVPFTNLKLEKITEVLDPNSLFL